MVRFPAIQVDLGYGKFLLAVGEDKDGSKVFLFSPSDKSHPVGEHAPPEDEHKPKENEIYVKCHNVESAEVFLNVVTEFVKGVREYFKAKSTVGG